MLLSIMKTKLCKEIALIVEYLATDAHESIFYWLQTYYKIKF